MAEQETQEARVGDAGFIIVIAFCMFMAVLILLLAVGLSVYADQSLADGGGMTTRASVERLWQGLSAALGALFGLLTGKRL